MPATRARAAGLGVLAIVAGAAATPAQDARWRPGERVMLSDYSSVLAVAVGRDVAWAATPNGLVGYDRRFRRWLPPLPLPLLSETRAGLPAAVDPADDSFWLGTRAGLLHYRPRLEALEEIPVPGGITDLTFDTSDPAGGPVFATPLGWRRLAPGFGRPEPVAAPPPPGRRVGWWPLAAALARFPAADAAQAAALTDEHGRVFHYTAAGVAPDGQEAWLGTDGRGLFRFDPLVGRLEPVPFGLLDAAVGAVLAGPAQVYAGSGAGSGRNGVSIVAQDLSAFRFLEAARGEFRSVRALLLAHDTLWAATDRGVVRAAGGEWRRWDAAAGLPSDNTLALAPGPHGLWIGTDRGLGSIDADGTARIVPSWTGAVQALQGTGDTLWAGTAAGLAFVAPGDARLTGWPVAESTSPLREPLVALARVGDTLVAATRDRLAWRAPGGHWVFERAVSPELGRLRSAAPDGGGVWLGGEGGFGFFDFRTRALLAYRVPHDVPGPVQHLAVTAGHIWVATPFGLVRYDRAVLGR